MKRSKIIKGSRYRQKPETSSESEPEKSEPESVALFQTNSNELSIHKEDSLEQTSEKSLEGDKFINNT